MAPNGDDAPYQPVDALKASLHGAAIIGGGGLFYAAVVNATRTKNYGAMGILTHSGGIVFTFTAFGAVYELSSKAAANLRQKNDYYNAGIGGFLAGSVLGLRSGRMSAVLGWGSLTSVTVAVYEYCGGSLMGKKPEIEGLDDYGRKEHMRMTRTRPIEETIAALGEGRGIEGPGYEERRRARLKEKYGVDINPVSAEAY